MLIVTFTVFKFLFMQADFAFEIKVGWIPQ